MWKLLVAMLNFAAIAAGNSIVCTREFVDQHGSLFPIPGSCEKFLMCRAGILEELNCPRGMLFDVESNRCIDENQAKCVTENWSAADGLCNDANGLSIHPDAHHCSRYVLCVGVTAIPRQCGAGLLFNSVTSQCDDPHNVVCDITCPIEGDELVFLKDSTGQNCARYYICVDGIPRPAECSSMLYFDLLTETCRLPENSSCRIESVTCLMNDEHVADPKSCFSYYKCEDGYPHYTECEGEYIFSNGQCVPGNCDDLITDNTENTTEVAPSTTEMSSTPEISTEPSTVSSTITVTQSTIESSSTTETVTDSSTASTTESSTTTSDESSTISSSMIDSTIEITTVDTSTVTEPTTTDTTTSSTTESTTVTQTTTSSTTDSTTVTQTGQPTTETSEATVTQSTTVLTTTSVATPEPSTVTAITPTTTTTSTEASSTVTPTEQPNTTESTPSLSSTESVTATQSEQPTTITDSTTVSTSTEIQTPSTTSVPTTESSTVSEPSTPSTTSTISPTTSESTPSSTTNPNITSTLTPSTTTTEPSTTTTTTALPPVDPTVVCRDVDIGIFRHPYNCYQYFVCIFGTGREATCSSGQIFDAQSLICVPGDRATCMPTPMGMEKVRT